MSDTATKERTETAFHVMFQCTSAVLGEHCAKWRHPMFERDGYRRAMAHLLQSGTCIVCLERLVGA